MPSAQLRRCAAKLCIHVPVEVMQIVERPSQLTSAPPAKVLPGSGARAPCSEKSSCCVGGGAGLAASEDAEGVVPRKEPGPRVEIWAGARTSLPLSSRLRQHRGLELTVDTNASSRHASPGSPPHPRLSLVSVMQASKKSSFSSASTSAPTTPRLTDRALARSEALLREMCALFESEKAGGPRTCNERDTIAMSETERSITPAVTNAGMPPSPGQAIVSMSEALQETLGFFESAESDDTADPMSTTRKALRKTERLLRDLREVDGLDDVDVSFTPRSVQTKGVVSFTPRRI